MKKIILVVAAAIMALFLLPSCEKIVGRGPLETETRNLSNFTGVSSEFSGKVNIHIDPVFKVEVSAQRNILNVIRTDVRSGVLHIDYKNNTWVRTHEDVIVTINMPYADYMHLSGSGNMDMVGDNASVDLDMQVSGSGSLFLQKATVTGNINARISGSGSMTIYDGTADYEKLKIDGSGNINFSDIEAQTAETNTNGSGCIKVHALKTLDVHISGSGSVLYKGAPQITAHINGSGKVKPM